MYSQPFYITKPVGNNAFSYDVRKNKQLYVPSLIPAVSGDDIRLTSQTTFEDIGFDDVLRPYSGLENFYQFDYNGTPLYLFDNHNHAYFFWYLSRDKKIIGDNNTLIHIDEHADTRDPGEYLLKPESYDLQKVFEYTNFVYNVGNYMIPAQKEGIIDDIIQVRNTSNLEDYLQLRSGLGENIILNLDLDFFQPDLDFIDYDLKKQVVRDAANRAKLITVSTSPFFIDQPLAIKRFRELFGL